MFSIENNDFFYFLWLYTKPSNCKKLWRVCIDTNAKRYGIENPERFANKKQILEMILHIWLDKFRQDPEFHKAYEKRWDFTFSTDLLE
jgi:hypothetical protein